MPGSIAPLVAGWNRWRTGFSPPPASPLGGEIPGTRKVELFIGEQWVDITRLDRDTPGVYYRDNITITRGKSDEAASLDRSTCRFTLNNRDGRFSTRNPSSPYYGLIGRNTPVRVSVVPATGIRHYRFYGEISSWPQKWDSTGTDVYVQVEAAGILRRLGQGSSPLLSPMYRTLVRDTTYLVAYWPCEDGSAATSLASAVDGVAALTISGTPTLASSSDFPCSSPLPVMGSASFTGYLPTYDSSQQSIQVRFLMSIPAAGATNGQVLCSLYTNGTISQWELYYGTGGQIGLRGYASGVVATDSGLLTIDTINGYPSRMSIELLQSGTSIQHSFAAEHIDTPNNIVTYAHTTVSSQTLGRATRVILAPSKGLTATAMGQLLVQAKITSLFDLGSTINAYLGEHAAVRIARLLAEEGINYSRWQPTADTIAMTYQGTDTLVNIINDCVSADMGRLSEPRDQVGLAYRDRESLYDQAATLALDYAASNLADVPEPVYDDTYTRNDITVQRGTNGSSARVTSDTGTDSIAAVGRYATSVTLNVQTDSQLPDIAGWMLHLGTVDEARYPQVSINLLHSTFTSDSTLTTTALKVDLGDRITIANPPAWLPPDTISLIAEGYTEVIGGNGQHTITFNCSPESPYHIPIYDNSTYRYASDGSTLTSALNATTTSVSVTTASGPIWSATDGSFDVNIAGERMTVTGISGSSSPQTFTVTRSVNGIIKTHAAGEDVSLFTPAYYAI